MSEQATTNGLHDFPAITLDSLLEMKRRMDSMPRIERRELTAEEVAIVEAGIGLGLIDVRTESSPQEFAAASILGFKVPDRPLTRPDQSAGS